MASIVPVKKRSLAERLALADKVTSGINDKAGKIIAGRIGTTPAIEEKLRTRFYPFPSRAINEAIHEANNGGIPVGRITIIAGLEDSGKTSIMIETIALNQKLDPDFIAVWCESEGSLDHALMKTLGIDFNRLIIVEIDPDAGGETTIDQLESYLKSIEPNMIVVNSLKCLVPSEEYKKSIGEFVVGVQARMNGRFMRKFTARLKEKDCSLVLITHLSFDIGSMSRDPLIISGGKAILFHSALTLDFRKKSLQDTDPIARVEGLKFGVSVKKNHVSTLKFPYIKTEYFIIFNEGTEQILTALNGAIEQGIYRKSGAWIYDDAVLIDDKPRSWQGKTQFRQYMKDNPEELERLLSMLDGKMISVMSDEEVLEAIQINNILDSNEKENTEPGDKKKSSRKKVS